MPPKKRQPTREMVAAEVMRRKAVMDAEVAAARERCQEDLRHIEARHMAGIKPLLQELIRYEQGTGRVGQ